MNSELGNWHSHRGVEAQQAGDAGTAREVLAGVLAHRHSQRGVRTDCSNTQQLSEVREEVLERSNDTSGSV